MSWYYANGSERVGPLSEREWKTTIQSGRVRPETLVWRDGMAEWLPFQQVDPDAAQAVVEAPPTSVDEISCAECGRSFPPSEVVRIGESWICGNCKPLVVQKLKEGVALPGSLNYAGFWIRFGAKIIDLVILWVLNMAVGIPLTLLGGSGQNVHLAATLLMFLAQIAVSAAYNIYFIGKFAATPGKMACGLIVVRSDGSLLTFGRAAGRYFAEWVTGATIGIGYIIAAFDDQKRALHDHIADTRVVYKK